MPTAVTWTVPVARWDSPGSAHAGVHQRVQTGHVSQGGSEGGQQAAAGGGARVGLDGPYLGADVGDAADVGVADDLDEPERSLAGGYLDQRLHVDVTVFDQPASPVAVGVYLGVRGGCPADRSDDKRGQRQRWLVAAEQAACGGDVDDEQPLHGHDPAAGPDGGGDQPAAVQERPHHHPSVPHRFDTSSAWLATSPSVTGAIIRAHERRLANWRSGARMIGSVDSGPPRRRSGDRHGPSL